MHRQERAEKEGRQSLWRGKAEKERVKKMAEGRQEREECKRWREEGPAEKGAKAVFPKFHLPTKRKPPATQVAGGRS